MIPSPAAVPVRPDAGEASGWLIDELAKPQYAAARPSPFDLAVQAFVDWFTGLFDASGSAAPPVLLAVALGLVAVVLVVALLLFGLPRLNRRSAAGALFGEDDARSAAEIRRAAAAAAARGDFSLAVLERFRAIARSLDERTLVAVFPGTTATGFGRSAAQPFPGEEPALGSAAALFDRVRYDAAVATREDAAGVAALDDRLAAARPVLHDPVAV